MGTQAVGPTRHSGTPNKHDGPSPDEFVRELYEEHRTALLRYVSSLLRSDQQRAEDIVQETLVRAWQYAAQQPQHWRPSRAWLCRVAHNLTVDWHRRERSRPEIQYEEVLAAQPEPVDAVNQADHRRFIVHALSRLSPSHREILFYVYVLGCTGQDAALALGIPEGTVKSRTHHAIRELRRRHTQHCLAEAA